MQRLIRISLYRCPSQPAVSEGMQTHVASPKRVVLSQTGLPVVVIKYEFYQYNPGHRSR